MANIVKAHILGAEEGAVDAAGRSTQLPEDTWDYNKTGAKEPPYNLDTLCVFLEINTWHYRCVKAKAISTAGLGFDFVVPEDVKEPDLERKRVLKEFFNHSNDEMTWGEILDGNLYLLRAEDGGVLWKASLGKEVNELHREMEEGFFVSHDKQVYWLVGRDGKIKGEWK